MGLDPQPCGFRYGSVRMARPRSEEVQQKVIAAAVALVAEVGVSGFTVDAVAKASGVAKTTIYRRWRSGDELLIAALDCSIEHLATPNTGSLRSDLVEMYTAVTAMFAQPSVLRPMLGALARAAGDPEFRRVLQDFERERHQPIQTILQLAQARGEIAADTDLELMMEFVEGPMVARKILKLGTFEHGEIERIADMVIAGLMALTGPSSIGAPSDQRF